MQAPEIVFKYEIEVLNLLPRLDVWAYSEKHLYCTEVWAYVAKMTKINVQYNKTSSKYVKKTARKAEIINRAQNLQDFECCQTAKAMQVPSS